MAILHRVQWIDTRIRQQAYPNLQQIIEKFEISRRQALRDIEYLRDSLGAPIAYSREHKGYRYTEAFQAVPALFISDEQSIILTGLSAHYALMANQHTRTSDVFGALSELLVRISGKSVIPLDEKAVLQEGVIPFTAILQPETDRRWRSGLSEELAPYYRGSNDLQQEIYEFYDSQHFIPAVLASGCAYRIVHPQWLKQKFVNYLTLIRQINIG